MGPSVLDSFQIMGKTAEVPTTTDLERRLRAADLRVTQPRLAVMAAVEAHPHADTETLIGAVRVELPTVSHQAVYDVLRVLSSAGLVRRIQPSGSLARYESRVGDNHHHVVCRSCGAIADVDCAVGHTPCLTASDDHGFVLDEAEVVYWGTCPDCAAARTSEAPHPPVPLHQSATQATPQSATPQSATPQPERKHA
jgi:Fur family ferric uptake transcriptional regulator